MGEPSFKCDPRKRSLVLKERRIDLLDMGSVFRDPKRLDFADERRDYGEQRRITIGSTEGRTFTVVYTQRDKVTWLITAWFSSRKERALYHGR